MSYTFRGEALPAKTSTEYVNLESRRVIKDLKKKGFVFLDVATLRGGSGGPFVTGSSAIIREFLEENKLAPSIAHSVTSPGTGGASITAGSAGFILPPPPAATPGVAAGALLPSTVTNIFYPPQQLPPAINIPSQFGKEPQPVQPRLVSTPAPMPAAAIRGPLPLPPTGAGISAQIQNLILQSMQQGAKIVGASCVVGSAGSAIITPAAVGAAVKVKDDDDTEIDKIPEDVIDNLCHFHLSGLKGRGRVTRIIDADTIEMVIRVPLVGLTQKVEAEGRGRARRLKAAAYTTSMDASFYAKFSCRLRGIDFAEHDTAQGMLAIKLMADLYIKYNNRVYYTTGKFDKYGRLLVDLYADKARSISINMYYDRRVFGDFGHIVESYFGKTKSDYMKNLQKVPPNLVQQYRDYVGKITESTFPASAILAPESAKRGKGCAVDTPGTQSAECKEEEEIDFEHGSVPHSDV